MRAPHEVCRAIVRLENDPDFKVFVGWLEEERNNSITDLLSNASPVHVHQLQGEAQCLTDILQSVMTAQTAIKG